MLKSIVHHLLDRSIYYAFDATGFDRHAAAFDPDDGAVDLSGKVCLVTGANSGIGKATALSLARSNATVLLLCRSEARGLEAKRLIQAEAGHDRVHVEVVDMARLRSVCDLADRLQGERIDVLIHNAGALLSTRTMTEDGLETTWATHVAGPFLLTKRLIPRLATGARVIFVSSGGMYTQRLDLTDVAWHERPFDGVVAYAQAKRAQVILSELWAERLGDRALVAAMHPGWVNTPGVEQALPRFYRFTRNRLRTPAQGADTVIWLAKAPAARLESGRFWFDRKVASTHLMKRTKETESDRLGLWKLCEEMTVDKS
ncbi:MAG: SDR family NAD(P)-dependent oxidoreductase [Deltaproteobacteria bacterium]|nr:SDR family NAD(P)-dependent oxidoreductase [Deltaproteobacteria bacterium]